MPTKGMGEAIASTAIPPSLPPDVPMSPRVRRTDSHCPQIPEEVGTVIVPLSGWRTEGQKDEPSQKNRAAHQTQAPSLSLRVPDDSGWSH